jgi:hypothetical protein
MVIGTNKMTTMASILNEFLRQNNYVKDTNSCSTPVDREVRGLA